MYFYFSRMSTRTTIRNILFVNLALMGDVILSSVIFTNDNLLEKGYSYYFITSEKYKEIFHDYNGVIKLIFINKRKYKFNLLYRLKLIKQLKELSFHKIYNLNFTRISIDDEISLLPGINSQTITFKNNPNLKRLLGSAFDSKYSELIERNINEVYIFNILSLTRNLFIKEPSAKTKVYFKSQNTGVNNFFISDYFVVNPYSSTTIKNWSLEKYKTLIYKLTEELNLSCVILGVNYDNTEVLRGEKVINKVNKTTISDSLNIIDKSLFFIGNDSGLLHAAIAMNKLCFAIVGGGVWGQIYPYQKKDVNYFYEKMDCFNCGWVCKYEQPLCIYNLSVNQVFNSIINSFSNDRKRCI